MKIEAIIKKAVAEAIEAGRKQAENAPADTYKATERRLYAKPDLEGKAAKDREHLRYLKEYGLQGRSKDVIRFQRSGSRLSPEELLDGLIKDLEATIAATEHEINTLNDALAPLTSDPYFRVIEGRFFEQKTDEQMAEELKCDASTVRRNRGRLVRRVAVRVYGVEAI